MKSHKIFLVVCSLILTCLLLATPADAQRAKPSKVKPPPPDEPTCNPLIFDAMGQYPSYTVSFRVISPGDNPTWDGMNVGDTRKTRILAWALTDGCILEWGEKEVGLTTFVIERLSTPIGYLGEWRVSPDPEVYYPEDEVVAELQDNNWDEDTVRATYEMPFVLHVFRDLDGVLSASFVGGMVGNDYGDGYPDEYVDGEDNVVILFDIPGDLRINVNQCNLKPKKRCPTIQRFIEFDFSTRLDTQ